MTDTTGLPGKALATAIDERMEIQVTIDKLDERKKALGEIIQVEMDRRNITKAFGTKGKGYQKITFIKQDYDEKALTYAKRQGIIALFTPPPKITRSKVLDALKSTAISPAQYKGLERFSGSPYHEVTLKTVEEKKETGEAKV